VRPLRRCSPGHFPSRAFPFTIPGSVTHVDTRHRGSCPGHACLREPSHLASIARPELRRLDSRTQDLLARCGRSNPRATRQAATQLGERSRRSSAPATSLTSREGSEAPCLRPLSAAPRASRALHDRYPQGVPIAGPRRRFRRIVSVGRPLARPAISLGVSFLLESAREFKLAAALAYPTFEPEGPTAGSPRGDWFRHRNHLDPSSHRSVYSPGPTTFAAG
jgi:hypothetical protein